MRATRIIALVLACAACGRLGYEPGAGADAGRDEDMDVGSMDARVESDADLDTMELVDGAKDAPSDAVPSLDVAVDADLGADASADAPVPVDASDEPDVAGSDAGAPAARPISPLATATVTHTAPTFRFALTGGADAGRVEVCRDAACASVMARFDGPGNATLTVPLPSRGGRFYWRVTPLVGGVVAGATSITWPFLARAFTAPSAPDVSWGSYLDVDDDGLADLAVLAPGIDEVRIFRGSPAGPEPLPIDTIAGTESAKRLSIVGDLDGNGRADLALGTPGIGRVRVLLSLSLGVWDVIDLGGPAGSEFGWVAVGIGDVDRDGYGDLAVGAPGAGEVHVFRGSASGPDRSADQVLTDASGRFGTSLASGDFDGDGLADLAIGAPDSDVVVLTRGLASGALTPATPSVIVGPGGSQFGLSIDGAGDISGDGYADLVVGAPGAMSIYMYMGSTMGLPVLAGRTIPGTIASLGAVVAMAGDTDANGFDDVLVADGRTTWALYPTEAIGWAPLLSQTMPALVRFTEAVATPGDMSGDLRADFGLGDPEGGRVIVFGGASSFRVDLFGPSMSIFGAATASP